MHELRIIGRSDWYVDEVIPTPTDQIEFMVRLRRLPRDHSQDELIVDELVPDRTRPDWLDDPGRVRRVQGLERKVATLEERLAERKARISTLRGKLERQRRIVRRQRAELEALRAPLPVRAARKARSSVRRLTGRSRRG
jgi:uncharacterized coiled-coil protein SlyX